MSAAEALDLMPGSITQRRASAAEITQARAMLRWWAGQRHAESNGYPAPLGEHRESTRSGVPSSRQPRGVSRGEEFGRFCALLEAARAINGPAMAVVCVWYEGWHAPALCAARNEAVRESRPGDVETIRAAFDVQVRQQLGMQRDVMRSLRRDGEALVARLLRNA